jgi:hypothetical protein
MKVEDILSYELLNKLYSEDKLSDSEIAKQYGLGLGQVHRLRNKLRIRTIADYERHSKQTLDQQEKALIVGLLLGDGHMRLQKGNDTNPSLMLEQSVKHQEYIYWLRDCLKDWVKDPLRPLTQNRHTSHDKTYHSYSFQTVHHPAFFELYHMFYKDGRKKLDIPAISQYFNVLSLAAWIMDDGSLTGNCKRNSIATNCFTLQEVSELRELLANRFKLKTWCCKRTTVNTISYEIAFDKKSSIELSNMLRDIVIPSMQYKLLSSETTNGTTLKK